MAIDDFATKDVNELLKSVDTRVEVLAKTVFTLILIYLTLPYFFDKNPWTIFDSADLLIHESGHLIFGFTGELIAILGGSLWQTLVPTLLGAYFIFKKSWYSVFFCTFWLGINIVYVAIYLGDAKLMNLPLLVEGSIHDWNYLLTNLNLLDQTEAISAGLRILGQGTIIIGFLGMAASLLKKIKS